jgi:hypothetical protein
VSGGTVNILEGTLKEMKIVSLVTVQTTPITHTGGPTKIHMPMGK